eukprot:symbB.v1.2.018648.t1/scaffold1450.1/size158887/8
MVNSGAFMLQNLMDSWAADEGYSRDQVLEAAQIHMFHEDRCSLRFEITQVQGDTRIKVNPRRGFGDRGVDRFPEEESFTRRSRRTRPKDEIVSDFEDDPPRRDETPPRRSTEEKLDVPLEELIGEPRGEDCSASSREPFGNREARVHRKMEQMGHTLNTAHSRRPPIIQEDRSGSIRDAPRVKRPPKPMSIDKVPMKKSPPVKMPPVPFPCLKTSSEGHKGMDVDSRAEKEEPDSEGFEEDDEMPSGPPGEHWQEFDDNGKTWFFYDGPKGKWACLNPGDALTKVED